MTSLLDSKTTIIYGGAGHLGRAIASTFASEGARVFLAGRTLANLQAAADQVEAETGTRPGVAEVDALDEAAVEAYVASVAETAGSVDVSFNLITRGDVQGTPLVDLSVDDLLRPIDVGVRSAFITARAAARRMTAQGGGVILYLTSATSSGPVPMMGGTGPADAATETLMQALAAETGRGGVRVHGIWTAAVAGTLTDEAIKAVDPNGPSPAEVEAMLSGMALLGRVPRLQEVADVAAFLASDKASGMTASIANVTAGLVAR
jgi:NAD(P)-dependent dehydrogenase (short-subunit alcohol dehydrogenase family)